MRVRMDGPATTEKRKRGRRSTSLNIYDVAQKAGVSTATVSRVINKSVHVRDETRQRVLAVLKELNYLPNANASSLTRKRTDLLALLVSDITNPFFTTVARGFEDKAAQHGFTVILCNTDENPEKEKEYVQRLLMRRIDGMAIAPTSKGIRHLEMVKKRQVALVLLDRIINGFEADSVRGDSVGGAQRLVSHLIGLGHRRIAAVMGPFIISTSADRLEGYKKALAEHGIPFDEKLVKEGLYRRESGQRLTHELLSLPPSERPTAIFAGNNFLALGVITAIREAGLRVPEDIAVVCFDDIESASILQPFLTVAAQPAYLMGTLCAEIIIQRLSGKGPSRPQDIVLGTELIIRESCGSANASKAIRSKEASG